MTITSLPSTAPASRKFVPIVAWMVTLLVSTLPAILFRELTGQQPSWLFAATMSLLGLGLVLTFLWKTVSSLRQYFIVLLVLNLAEWGFTWIGKSDQWHAWFGSSSFSSNMLSTQLLRLGVAIVMVITLLVLKRHRSEFFLVRGDTNAPVGSIRWLGVNEGMGWKRFGVILSLCISLGTLAFTIIAGRPSLSTIAHALPFLPVILLLALMNSFSEEMSYRASELSTLNGAVSPSQALLLTAYYFGIGHYYGVPYGVVGVVMASILGWLLGKSMLETKGYFWAWLIHFLQDVVIFSFMAIGSIVPGG